MSEDIKLNITKNFITDLTGIDYYNKKIIHGIVGFYVLGFEENSDYISFRGVADFVNVDTKNNNLITNLYFGNIETELAKIHKLIYCYEVLYDTDKPTIQNNAILFKNDWAYHTYTKITTDPNEVGVTKLMTSLDDMKKELGDEFRIAFEFFPTQTVTETSGGILAAAYAYEAFRPIVDIHNLKVFVNLISITQETNGLFHTHDLGITQEINRVTPNPLANKDHSVSSLVQFQNYNESFNIKPVEVCYEDWNLLNL